MAIFTYPSNAELMEIEREKMPRLQADRLGFQIMPTENHDAAILMWEQEDNYTGLQQLRGLGGDPPRVKAVGAKRYQMEPGYYGEFRDLDETELTLRRNLGTFVSPVDISDLVMRAQDHLLERRLDRIEAIIWTLLATGTFSISSYTGLVHTDTYTTQTYNASTWSTVSTATPLADMRAVQLLGRGKGVNFNAQATAYMNRVTWNNLISNSNTADLGGRVTVTTAPADRGAAVNAAFAGEDLPQFRVYDEGYLNDSATFVPYIGNGVVVVIGARPAGQRIGAYAYTRNANNPGMAPGPYMKVVDQGENTVPRRIDVHDGHNGGPVLRYPSAIVRMDVS